MCGRNPAGAGFFDKRGGALSSCLHLFSFVSFIAIFVYFDYLVINRDYQHNIVKLKLTTGYANETLNA